MLGLWGMGPAGAAAEGSCAPTLFQRSACLRPMGIGELRPSTFQRCTRSRAAVRNRFHSSGAASAMGHAGAVPYRRRQASPSGLAAVGGYGTALHREARKSIFRDCCNLKRLEHVPSRSALIHSSFSAVKPHKALPSITQHSRFSLAYAPALQSPPHSSFVSSAA